MHPLCWKRGFLTTGPPGKYQEGLFLCVQSHVRLQVTGASVIPLLSCPRSRSQRPVGETLLVSWLLLNVF